MDIEPWSRLMCSRHQITSEWRIFECVDAKKRHGSRKHLICQKVIVPYMKDATWWSKTSDLSKSDCSVCMKDADNDILFTMKDIDMKCCKVV